MPNLPLHVGRCHDQSPGLPKGVGPTDVMYGVKTIKGISKVAVFTSETLKSDICFQSVPLECTTWSAQLDRLWSAEQEATGLNPSRTNTQGLKMMEQEVLHL